MLRLVLNWTRSLLLIFGIVMSSGYSVAEQLHVSLLHADQIHEVLTHSTDDLIDSDVFGGSEQGSSHSSNNDHHHHCFIQVYTSLDFRETPVVEPPSYCQVRTSTTIHLSLPAGFKHARLRPPIA